MSAKMNVNVIDGQTTNLNGNEIYEQTEKQEKLEKKLSKSEKSVKKYQWMILRLLVILAVIWLLFFVVIGLTHMPSGDMYPRIDAGDMVLFYRLDKDVKAQDVIAISKKTPDSDKKETYILRVVAVSGDTVDITEAGALSINGNYVAESNIFFDTAPYEGYTQFPLTLQDGECFVLADYRNGGSDSRYFGPVDKSEILGTVITIFRRNGL